MSRAEEIIDRQRTTDVICDVMHAAYRDTTIDHLLTRPHQAMEMATRVAVKMERISKAEAKRVEKALATLQEQDAHALEVIHEICRCALSSRKRGDLKRDRY